MDALDRPKAIISKILSNTRFHLVHYPLEQ